jgi:hypothetical protein
MTKNKDRVSLTPEIKLRRLRELFSFVVVEKGDEPKEPKDAIERVISEGVIWARRILEERGFSPYPDLDSQRKLLDRIFDRNNVNDDNGLLLRALWVIASEASVRRKLKTSHDLELAHALMNFCLSAWSGKVCEFSPTFRIGRSVAEGGAKGRAARPPKLTAKQRADIRQEMDSAKHGTKKAIKLALADKHRISVREIERIAAEK